MQWNDTNEKYMGQWFGNLQQGLGLHIWNDKNELKALKNRYLGEWVKGKKNGYGIFFYSNGTIYEGEWVEDLKSGKGIFRYFDGKIDEREFLADRPVDHEEVTDSPLRRVNSSQEAKRV